MKFIRAIGFDAVVQSVFAALLAAGLIGIFYQSKLRERIENELIDIRVRVGPENVGSTRVSTILISEPTITALDGDRLVGGSPAGATQDLSFSTLIRLVESALKTRATAVIVMLHPEIFSYSDPALGELTRMALSDARLVFNTFGITDIGESFSGLPTALQSVPQRVARGEIMNEFRRSVVRTLPIADVPPSLAPPYLMDLVGSRMDASASLEVAQDAISISRDREHSRLHFRLNYSRVGSIPILDAQQLLGGTLDQTLANRALVIGYGAYRALPAQATRVNSPWQTDGGDLREGIPVALVSALGLDNLLERAWLTDVHWIVNVVQTLFFAGLALLAWRAGITAATLTVVSSFVVLLVVHAWIMAYANSFVPLADTVMWASVATVAGALLRLRVEGKIRAIWEARASTEGALAATQGQFLDALAHELGSINNNVLQLLEKGRDITDRSGVVGDTAQAWQKARSSSEELKEYLAGIQGLSQMNLTSTRSIRRRSTPLDHLVDRVVRRFDFRADEQDVEILVEGLGSKDLPVDVLTDGPLAEQILYNLISNAVKYSPTRGVVIVRGTDTGGAVQVSVIDRGPGIPRELQEKIFEKFYRIKDDHVYRVKGHGLGLFLSRYFALRLGTHVAVQSSPGNGSVFSVTFPMARNSKKRRRP